MKYWFIFYMLGCFFGYISFPPMPLLNEIMLWIFVCLATFFGYEKLEHDELKRSMGIK